MGTHQGRKFVRLIGVMAAKCFIALLPHLARAKTGFSARQNTLYLTPKNALAHVKTRFGVPQNTANTQNTHSTCPLCHANCHGVLAVS